MATKTDPPTQEARTMPDDRTYIRVHDGFDEHPKVEGLSDAAFRLLITTWTYSSRNATDGRLTLKSWTKRGTPKARRELIAAGLIEAHDDHVQAHDYLEHQRSAADIELLKSVCGDSGGYGNHVRWHVVRKKPKGDCEFCQNPPEGDRKTVANAIAKPSQAIASTEAETEVPTTERGDLPSVGIALATTPLPRRCATHLTDPAPPPCGACKDTRVRADAWTAPSPLRLVPALNRCLIHDTSYERICAGCRADQIGVTA